MSYFESPKTRWIIWAEWKVTSFWLKDQRKKDPTMREKQTKDEKKKKDKERRKEDSRSKWSTKLITGVPIQKPSRVKHENKRKIY